MNLRPGRSRPGGARSHAPVVTFPRPSPLPLALGCLLLSATPDLAAQEAAPAAGITLAPLRVRAKSASVIDPNLPATVQRIDAAQLRHLNIVNAEDGLKYMPAFGIRKRFIGDENATFSVRGTSNQQSARGLVYLDGMLLSNLLNNSWSTPPRWSMAFPDHLARMEVIYGAYSALYPGNAIGATVLMTTRMPERLELGAQTQLFTQHVHQYGVDRDYGGSRQSASLGDRVGKLSFLLGVAHLQSNGQPLVYATQGRSDRLAGAATPVTGAYVDRGANGQPRVVLGVSSEGQEATSQDEAKLKLAYDFSPTLRGGLTVGYWNQQLGHRTESFLRDPQGHLVRAGTVAIEGRSYTLPVALFAPSSRRSENAQYGLSLETHRDSGWNLGMDASYFELGKNQDRAAGSGALENGPGQLTLGDGSRWRTLDLRASHRPARLDPGSHWLSLGYHYDGYTLDNDTYALTDWRHGRAGAPLNATGGDTQTQALYAQDAWRLSERWQLTYGLRWEQWRAFGGFIASGASDAALAPRRERHDSPKAALNYWLDENWQLRLAVARAYRFPTVGELFQGSFSGLALVNNNPLLKPENDLSRELSAERALASGLLRFSLYRSDTRDTLFNQTDYTVFPNVTNVQNVGRVRTRGAEASYEARAVGWDWLDLSTNAAYTQATVMENRQNPASVGKQFYRIPRWRANLIATWHAGERGTLTLAGRYSGRQYNTLDHSDIHPDTFGGVSDFLTWDAKWDYRVGSHWELGVGIDNLTDRRYYVYYPYPSRTLYVEAKVHL